MGHRVSKYRKIEARLWNDAKFMSLSDDGKLIFLLLLTHPNQTSVGAMKASVASLADDLGWVPERVSKGFAEAVQKGLVEHDPNGRMIALPNFLRYNPPENPNVLKGMISALDLLPECRLKLVTMHRLKSFAEGLSEGFQKAFPEWFDKALANGMPNPEPEPEPEPYTGSSLRSEPDGHSVDQIVTPTLDLDGAGRSLVLTPQQIEKPKKPVKAKPENITAEEGAQFEVWWRVYPHKVSKQDGLLAFVNVLRFTDVEPPFLAERAQAYGAWLQATDTKPANAATWLNARRWEDELTIQPRHQHQPRGQWSSTASALSSLDYEEEF